MAAAKLITLLKQLLGQLTQAAALAAAALLVTRHIKGKLVGPGLLPFSIFIKAQ
jgi:hypothetical protein